MVSNKSGRVDGHLPHSRHRPGTKALSLVARQGQGHQVASDHHLHHGHLCSRCYLHHCHRHCLPHRKLDRSTHTCNLSREPRVYLYKFFLAGVNFYRFNAKNWHFRQILRKKVAFFTDLMRKIGVFRCKFYSPKILPV